MSNPLIEKMIKEWSLKAWSNADLARYINKQVNVDGQGNCALNGVYSIEELEAVLSCACMERATPKFD